VLKSDQPPTTSTFRGSDLTSSDDPLCRFPEYVSGEGAARSAGTLSPMRDYSLVEGGASQRSHEALRRIP